MNVRNLVIVTGNLGADPQVIRKEKDGGAVVRLSIAVSEYRFDSASKVYEQSRTTWIPVVAFSVLATRAGENLKKGDFVTVYGKLRSSTFETKGVKQTKLEIIADDLIISDVLPKSASEAFGDIVSKVSQISSENFNNSMQEEESLEK